MKIFGYTLAQIKKSVVTGLGFAIAILTLYVQGGFGPAQWIGYAIVVLGLCTTALAFVLKNAPADPPIPTTTV